MAHPARFPGPADGKALSQAGFADKDWLVATVPGTVLTSYWNAGALPDPNFGDNQLRDFRLVLLCRFLVSRRVRRARRVATGQHAWLNFDGINWKAEVFLNGESLGPHRRRIHARPIRCDRQTVHPARKNALAVRIIKNATPGSVKEKTFDSPDMNGGALGADNPTYHASAGWDWIPTIRGRDTGIWSDVYLTTTGAVTIENPFVTTTLPLPDTSRADVTIEATLRNQRSASRHRNVCAATSATCAFETAGDHRSRVDEAVKLTVDAAALHLQNPKLWWPAGMANRTSIRSNCSL